VSSPTPQPSTPDWRDLLLTAIQQRDASRALPLAQRCVHRYGMHTLETLMEQASGGDGPEGDPRSWLLPLLSKSSPSAAPAQPLAVPAPPVEQARLPVEPAQPPVEAPLPETPAKEIVPPPRSRALDEAFAPLEIAFAPLPSPLPRDRTVGLPQEPPTALVASPLEEWAGFRVQDGDGAIPRDPAPIPQEFRPEEPPGPPESFASEPDSSEPDASTPFLSDPFAVEGFREDSLEEGAAAPVPTFLGEEPLAQHAPSPKPRSSGRREKRSPAPISRAMEPWLVWLPGVFRSRPRP